ncbi:unnamed protein product [Phytomonas sp. EM1]|nr:unnamed protein product [Phytomonas sp. EM1]|eukprot:CCW62103.1 unnamed protein product [Phytomonas sp. isolate EM1]
MSADPPPRSRSQTTTPSPPPLLPKGCQLLCENVFEDDNLLDDGGEEIQMRRQPTMLCRGSKLVAPLTEKEKQYTVVFDLDETVVYARDGPLYTRAYLKDLLRAIKDHFEVIVWTAGEREYAKNVLAEINEDCIIRHLVYRHKKWFHGDDYTKDLRQLGRDLDYTIMIDNTPDCVRANPENSIIVADFEVLSASEETGGKSLATTECEGAPASKSIPSVGNQPLATSMHPELNDSASSSSSSQHVSNRAGSEEVPEGEVARRAEEDESYKTMPKPVSKTPRAATDRTLYLLKEVLVALVRSGQTVPEFLARCELLSKQVVIGSNGDSIPIYYLGMRRRRKDAGQPKKVVKENRDRPVGKRGRRQEDAPANNPGEATIKFPKGES